MTVKTIIAAAGATSAAAAASAAVWLAVAPQNSGSSASGSSSGGNQPAATAPAPGSQDVVVVCVGTGRILHAPTPGGGCAAGQEPLSLVPAKVCQTCPPFEEPKPDTDEGAVSDLEQRISALENKPYFEVVNDEERPVFRVGPDGVKVFNKAGSPVAAFASSQYGGYFTASSATQNLQISMGAVGATAGVQITEDGLARMTIAAREKSGASFRIPSADGTIAGIGASVDGPGALLLGTLEGRVRSTLTVPDGRGMIRVRKDDVGGGVTLTEQGGGGGMFEIDTAKGEAAIKMGHLSHRYGIVMAGPRYNMPLIPKSGLPGSYFLGCGGQAPPACMPPQD
jgi:hypothetical protein